MKSVTDSGIVMFPSFGGELQRNWR